MLVVANAGRVDRYVGHREVEKNSAESNPTEPRCLQLIQLTEWLEIPHDSLSKVMVPALQQCCDPGIQGQVG